ncbi:MAG TPA: hypothetical protein VMI56_22655 [Reyranella sp.]|nr:hypothetical protein [Reyranella sp.]
MMTLNRRSTLAFLAAGSSALAIAPFPAFAEEDLYVPTRYENFKRGDIHSLDPATRGLVIVWPDKGRVKLKASDLVVKTTSGYSGNAYSELKDGQTVDVHWYDYLDFLIAKTTPAVTAHAKAMVQKGARIEGLPGSEHAIRLFTMAGMVTKTDPASGTVFIINASGGEPDKPAPDSGEVIQMPQIKTEPGLAALKALKPGDMLTTVYSVQTAVKVAIIR